MREAAAVLLLVVEADFLGALVAETDFFGVLVAEADFFRVPGFGLLDMAIHLSPV